jgi:hypothetical protein
MRTVQIAERKEFITALTVLDEKSLLILEKFVKVFYYISRATLSVSTNETI